MSKGKGKAGNKRLAAKYAASFFRTEENKARKQKKIEKRLAKAKARRERKLKK